MLRNSCAARLSPTAIVGVLLALSVPMASAGVLETVDALEPMSFTGGEVEYDPDISASSFKLSSDNRIRFAIDGEMTTAEGVRAQGARGYLVAETGEKGELVDGSFEIFGVIPSAVRQSSVTLLRGSLDAMRDVNGADGVYDFMISEQSVAGEMAQLYRGSGIFLRVAGINEVDWINGFQSSSALAALLRENGEAANATSLIGVAPASANPSPGTIALFLAAGMPLLLRRRGRASPKRP